MGGVVEGFAAVFGPSVAGELGAAMGGFQMALESGEYEEFESKRGQELGARFMNILTNNDIPRLDMLSLLLAFKLESASTGTRRFSIQAVNRWYKMINLKDARGEGAVLEKLRVVESMFQKRVKRAHRDIGVLNRLVTKGPARGEPVFPSPGGQIPGLGTAGAPREQITITPADKAIPYRPAHQTSR
jgi:hypothetical protein